MDNEITKDVNPHFEDFIFDWNCKFYLLCGGYGSSKSYHIALKLILKCLEEKRKVLVVRQVFDTIRDSCFSLLTEIIDDLGLEENVVKYTVSPMRINFANGSQIIFKGLDKPKKLKSINGVSIIWIEEASEISYAAYKELLGRVRHPSLSLHFILSTNPIDKNNWVFQHFFVMPGIREDVFYAQRQFVVNNTFYHHSVADDNYFLPAGYIEELDNMKNYDPDLYRVARQGRFGVNGRKVLPQFEVLPHDVIMAQVGGISQRWYRTGMDFGFEDSYNAVVRMAIDDANKTLYIFDEYYKNRMTDDETAHDPDFMAFRADYIKADPEDPKAISYFRKSGYRISGARKFAGSRLAYTRKVKRFRHIYCSEKCKNCIKEMAELTYALDRSDNIIPDEFNIDPHTFSAVWYGLDDYDVADIKGNYGGYGRHVE